MAVCDTYCDQGRRTCSWAADLSALVEPTPSAALQMLYIQMEFCPRTLRQALDDGSDLDAWQVCRMPVCLPCFPRPDKHRGLLAALSAAIQCNVSRAAT